MKEGTEVAQSIVTGLWAGRPGFNSWQGQGTFHFATMSRLPPSQWILVAISSADKGAIWCQGKNIWGYNSTPHTSLWCGVLLSTRYVFGV
jgi:hypothetical protein